MPPAFATDESVKKAAERKWAKGVATDFLDAAFNGKLEQAESLMDLSLKKSFAKEGEKRLREWLNNSIAILHAVKNRTSCQPEAPARGTRGKLHAVSRTWKSHALLALRAGTKT